MSLLTSTTRNAGLADVIEILQAQRAHSVDIVAPAHTMRFKGGNLIVSGVDPSLDDDGVTEVNGIYLPTVVADEGLSEKLGIPVSYLRRLRAERPALLDANLNAWLKGQSIRRANGEVEVIHEPDTRSFLLRLFRGDDGGQGIMRALLSPRYRVMDSLDALLALLSGVREAGVNVTPEIDLTDRRMIVRLNAPEITTLAPALLGNYRSPFTGQSGADIPVVSAGIVFSNSEVGNGAWSIVPRVTFEVCKNGMTITKDADRQVHLGGVQSEGLVEWSAATQKIALDLIAAKTRDAVKTYLSADYMDRMLAGIEEAAAKPVQGSEAAKVVKNVGLTLGFNKGEQAGILDHFMNSGQMSAGGLMQAITAWAQDDSVNADDRLEMEGKAMRVLTLV
jgi:hypothetical protein